MIDGNGDDCREHVECFTRLCQQEPFSCLIPLFFSALSCSSIFQPQRSCLPMAASVPPGAACAGCRAVLHFVPFLRDPRSSSCISISPCYKLREKKGSLFWSQPAVAPSAPPSDERRRRLEIPHQIHSLAPHDLRDVSIELEDLLRQFLLLSPPLPSLSH